MSIKRTPRPTTHYTVLANAVLRDENLSFRARGILAAILSRPDNWKTTSESLARETKEGRTAILTALRELEKVGYMTRKKYQNEKGQWIWESLVYDKPQKPDNNDAEPQSGFPTTGNPTSDVPTSENGTLIEVTNKKERKEVTELTRTYGDDVINACNLLADLIEQNGSKRPEVTDNWLRDMERLHRLDGRSWEQITAAINWVQNDSFWRANVMSPSKLRAQYDQLRLKAQAQQKQSAVTKTINWLTNINWDEQKEIGK
jgi:hypothetical protein